MRAMRTFVAVMSMLVLAAFSVHPVSAQADENLPATADELEAKARVFRDKANDYRQEAAANRALAERHKGVRDPKGRPVATPEQRKLVAALQAMAAHDELLAKDAEKIAAFYTRQAEAARGAAGTAAK